MRRPLQSPREPLRWPLAADVHGFAVLAGVEAVVRGTVLAVFPLLMYRAWGDAALVSQWYLSVGVVSLLTALLVPLLGRYLRRRRVYFVSVSMYLMGAALGAWGGKLTTLALLCHSIGAASSFVCFNAYVLEHVDKADFGRLESLRMFYGGLGWTLGPLLGVWSLKLWQGAPFAVVAMGAMAMLTLIRVMRLGDLRTHSVARHRPASHNPLAILRRFFAQPRLVAGWFFALMRSCGWWVYFVYVGIYAVQNGLGDQVGGVATSVANAGLFLAPLMLRWIQRHSVRRSLRGAFLLGGACFLTAAALSSWPWPTVLVLILGTLCLVLLDVCAGLPFMMAVKPSQRTEMSAVYSSFRDFSGILSPALAWVVLQFSPVAGVFAMAGVCLLAGWVVAGYLHPQLGVPGALRPRGQGERLETAGRR
ncbi:MFS transporter [Hydrogenophaga sp. RWCD_12]|uniref:MFS transporter n=1 Tax=Hydrogenophaga sp. RWCD_12 TaxID=3391190 RepID=UPI0039852742